MKRLEALSYYGTGTSTKAAVKASAGRIHGLEVSNPNTADAFLQLFDALTANVTVGTTTPTQTFLIPAGDGTVRGAVNITFPVPLNFKSGIMQACTTTPTGSGNPSAALTVNIQYS